MPPGRKSQAAAPGHQPVHAPWHVVQNEDKPGERWKCCAGGGAGRAPCRPGGWRAAASPSGAVALAAALMPRLKDVDLSPSTTGEAYRARTEAGAQASKSSTAVSIGRRCPWSWALRDGMHPARGCDPPALLGAGPQGL